jgi:integrase
MVKVAIRKIGKSYQIVISLGADEQGKQIRKYKTFRPAPNMTEKQALKEVRRLEIEFENNCKFRSDYNENMTLRELCDWYFENIAPQTLRESTIDGQKNMLENHILNDLGRFRLREISPAMLDKHFMTIRERGSIKELYKVREDFDLMAFTKGKGLSAYRLALNKIMAENTFTSLCKGETLTSKEKMDDVCDFLGLDCEKAFERVHKPLNNNFIRKIGLALSAVFSSAVKKQIMRENPFKFVTAPKKAEISHTVLDLEQASLLLRLLEDCKNHTHRALFKLLLFTGIRSGEARALLWDDIDFDTGLMTINKGLDNKGRITPPKTSKSVRIINLTGSLLDFLKEYKSEQTENVILMRNNRGIVFPNSFGDYMTEGVAITALKKLIKGTALPQTLTVHGLRHTNASLLISEGNTPTTVSALLGHSKTSTTLNIYAHSFQAQQAKALEGLALHLTNGAEDKEQSSEDSEE